MSIKHALIVDDSKSARLVLKRMLNDLDLDVDTVESARDAMDYLEEHTPDIIFMDHMMPGMDGFEAVKQIKNNAETAIIPIMMYTSRGGDVYLSQARELGAVGVIPKTISPVGLKESLFKLGLVKDRRVRSTLKVEDKVVAGKEGDKPQSEDEKQQVEQSLIRKQAEHEAYIDDLRKLMDDQTIELHKSMWLGIESVSHEIFNRLKTELDEQFKKIQPADQSIGEQEISETESVTDRTIGWPMVIVATVLVASLILNITLLSNTHKHENESMAIEVEQIDVVDEEQAATEIYKHDQKAIEDFIKWAQGREIEYPFDELALNENRLPSIEELIKKAVEANYTGSIILQTHVGKFCLSRDVEDNYKLAEDSLSITQCEYIGNHIQPYDVPSAHQSLAFANYLSDLDSLKTKGIDIDVTNKSRAFELSKYPRQGPQTTAEEWNLAAKLNNRIIVILQPDTVASQVETDDDFFEQLP